MACIAIGDGEFAAGDGTGDEESSGFDAIGNDGMGGAMKFWHAPNTKSGGFIAVNLRAHFAEEVNQVGDFGFAGGVFEDRFAVGQSGGQQDFFRAGYRDFLEYDVRAPEPAAIWDAGLDVAVFGGDPRAHF